MRNQNISIQDLIGKPFVDGGRGPAGYDCYGLVMEVMRRYGIALPDYGCSCLDRHDPAAIAAACAAAGPHWTQIPTPEPGCLVAIAYPYPGLISHVGVVIAADRFIHTRAATGGVTIDRLSSPAWRKRIRGYWRYVGEAVDITPDIKEPATTVGSNLPSLSSDSIPTSYNPFCRPVGWKSLPVPLSAGASIADVIHAHFPGMSRRTCIVLHNRHLDPDWSSPVSAGDNLLLVPRLAGGGGIGGILRPLAMIAVAALAVYTGGAAATALGLFTTTMTATATITSLTATGMFVSAAVGTAVMVAGSMMINALLPPPDLAANVPSISGLSSTGAGAMGGTMTYGWHGPRNSWDPELAIPILYGAMRCGGQVINYYVETNNYTNAQTMHMLLAICEGEVATPPADDDDIYIGENKLSSYEEYSWDVRAGVTDQEAIGGFAKLHQYRQLSIEIVTRCVLMLHFNASPFVDSSPAAASVTTSGTVTLDTTNKKYGAGSGLFNGSSFVYVADSPRFIIEDKNFCLRLWVKLTDDSRRYHGLMCHGGSTPGGWNLFYDSVMDIVALTVFDAIGACNTDKLKDLHQINMFDGDFHYVELNRTGVKQGIWVDGKEVGGAENDWNYPDTASSVNVGLAYVDSAWRYAKGNIDDAQIIIGQVLHEPYRWSSAGGTLNFSPPGEIADDYDFVVATRGECDEITVYVEFPNGLFEVNSSSVLIDHSCEFAIHYRAVGAGAWTQLGGANITVTANQREPVRRQYSITGLARGKYEVKLARVSPEETSTLMMSDLYWTGLDEIVDEELVYPYTALLGIHIKASDQLSGPPPTVTSVWDRGTITVKGSISSGAFIDTGTMSVASSNPAWAAYDLLTNERYGYKIPPSRLDYASWDAWADWCDGTVDGATRITLNGILDSQMTLAAALNKICQHGRAQITQAGQTLRVAVEAPVSSAAQVFGPGNILEGSATTEFLPRSSRPDMYYIEYLNAAYDYRRDKVPIKSAGYDSLTRVPITESLFLWGCTSEDEARRYGLLRMHISDRLNRVRSWSADVDAIACLPGDMVLAQDEGNDLTYGGRLGDQTGVADDVIVLDQAITLAAATYDGNCTVWVRLADDSLESRTITGPWDTETDTFTLDTDLVGKGRDDVCVIGRATGEALKYRVTNIARDVDCQFTLSGLEYDETVYYHSDYDGGKTPI